VCTLVVRAYLALRVQANKGPTSDWWAVESFPLLGEDESSNEKSLHFEVANYKGGEKSLHFEVAHVSAHVILQNHSFRYSCCLVAASIRMNCCSFSVSNIPPRIR